MILSKIRMEFSRKLRTIRSQNHLTQKQLADSLGISTKTLSHYEHYGKPCPTIMKRITLMFPDEFNDSLYKILDDRQFFISFYGKLRDIFYLDQECNSKYTPESIFLRVVSLYFSTRNWSDNKYVYNHHYALPAYFALHKIDIDTLLSSLFHYELSLDEFQRNTIKCLQDAVFLLTNIFYFQYRQAHFKNVDNSSSDSSNIPYTPNIPLILSHLRKITQYTFNEVYQKIESFCADLDKIIKELSNQKQTWEVQSKKERLEYILSSLKTTPQNIRNYERGVSSPSIPLLETLFWTYGFGSSKELIDRFIRVYNNENCFPNYPLYMFNSSLPACCNAYVYLAVLQLLFKDYHFPYTSLLPHFEFDLKPLYEALNDNYSYETIPGTAFYEKLEQEATSLGILGIGDHPDSSCPWTVKDLSDLSQVPRSTFYRYYKFTSPTQPTIQKILDIRNKIVQNPCFPNIEAIKNSLFFCTDQLFQFDSFEFLDNNYSYLIFNLQYCLHSFSLGINQENQKNLENLLLSIVDISSLSHYLPEKFYDDNIFYEQLYVNKGNIEPTVERSHTEKTNIKIEEKKTEPDNNLPIDLFAKNIAEILIHSSFLDKYLRSYQIPKDLVLCYSKNNTEEMSQKRELLMNDLIMAITASYKHSKKIQNILNQYLNIDENPIQD